VIPLLVAGVGILALVGAALVLHSFGPGLRLGRLIAATPGVSVEAAVAAARDGHPRYVRITGRIDSETDFEDEHHRPLVFRRRRLEVRRGGRWLAIDDARESVPFEIRDGLTGIGIDADALDDGLVVIPREALGTAADATDRVPADVPPDAHVRLRIEQVSSVEHAVVLGVPVETETGTVQMTAGAGRPLVLTTLEPDEAIRLLAGGRRTRPILASGLLAGGAGLIVIGTAWAVIGGIR
jgi:hypothetical protein